MKTATPDRISTIVRVLMALYDYEQADLAGPAKISEATVSRRLTKGGWKADELDGLARHFGVPVATFFLKPQDVRRALGLDGDGVTAGYPTQITGQLVLTLNEAPSVAPVVVELPTDTPAVTGRAKTTGLGLDSGPMAKAS